MPSSIALRRFGLLLVVLGVAGAAAAYWFLKPRPVDMVKVIEANNRGIGYMERFQYEKAVPEFEEVVRLAPRWQPGHINLGIALLNRDGSETAKLAKPIAIFEQLLKEDPTNNYADYCLGIMREHQGNQMKRAAQHFEAVTKRDPTDPHSWFFLGSLLNQLDEPKRAVECLEKAAALDPYLAGVFYGLQGLYRRMGDDKKADELLDRFKRLKDSAWGSFADKKYAEMGKYAEVIGRNPRGSAPPTGPLPIFIRDDKLNVKLDQETRWATAADFGKGPEGDLLRAVRKRFGGALVVFDGNGDGKLDLFLAGAVVRGKELSDLLLVNDGGGKFRDATREAGLVAGFKTLGCTVADFDNDNRPDLLLTGTTGIRLLRNAGGAKEVRFDDVTKTAGLDQLTGVCLGAAFADLDQDSDLDLVVAVLGADSVGALAALQNAAEPVKGAGTSVFLNVGEAPAMPNSKNRIPLNAQFRSANELFPTNKQPAHNLAISDLDGDRDVDVFVFGDREAPVTILNDRLLKFHRGTLPESVLPKGSWNGTAVLDVNRDEKSDLFIVGPGQKPALLLQEKAGTEGWFTAGISNAPSMLQAHAVDIDLDGWTDIVGLTDEHKPALLHNDGGKLVHVKDALGTSADWPKDIAALVPADLDERCRIDVVLWSESDGLRLYRSQDNGNRALPVQLIGRLGVDDSGSPLRCSSDGIGTRIGVQVRDHWTCAELATLHAGLGQSRQPILFGLAKHNHADFVSLRWPDGVWQAELNLVSCQRAKLQESNRKTTSCPILFTWNGRQFEYITDFLGAGSLGEPLPGGGHRPPRPEESVRIEAHQLAPKDGRYVLKFAEPMDEVTYLDRLRLVVVDHPADVRAYPDERFQSESRPATQDLLVFSSPKQVFAEQAKDHRGRDLTRALEQWDRQTADGFAKRSWIGFAEEHYVELDFGSRLAQFGPKDGLTMFLAGWTDYPYPESIWAASQAGHTLLAPVLERLGDDGKWHVVRDDLSFPAGLPRMMTYDVTGLVGGPSCKLRIRTNMHVYWDQIFIAPLIERVAVGPASRAGPVPLGSRDLHLTTLDVQGAVLENRGCVQEYSPDGKEPTVYAYDKLDKVAVTRQSGRLTKFGDVKELLTERDDRFVIFGPGDELTVTFDADRLPPLMAGWQRSFVLQTWGYCKDCSPFTATGDTIGPLPFNGMKSFPYGRNEYPDRLQEYQRIWNTRQIGSASR